MTLLTKIVACQNCLAVKILQPAILYRVETNICKLCHCFIPPIRLYQDAPLNEITIANFELPPKWGQTIFYRRPKPFLGGTFF